MLIPGNLSIFRGLQNAVYLHMLQIGALPRSRAPETKKRQSGDWRSRVESKYYPVNIVRRYIFLVKGEITKKKAKPNVLDSPVRSVLELEGYDSLDLLELGRRVATRNEGRAMPEETYEG